MPRKAERIPHGSAVAKGPSKVGPGSLNLSPTSYSYNHEKIYSRDPEIIDFGVWTAPGAAPPFGVVSGATGAVQTPRIDDFWVPEKTGFHDDINTKLGFVAFDGFPSLSNGRH